MNIEERKLWIILVLLVAGVAFAIGSLSTHATQPVAKLKPVWKTVHRAERPETPSSAFKESADRLQQAFRLHSDLTETEMIQKANRTSSVQSEKPCPFEWRDGQPELQVGEGQIARLSLARSFSKCAQAIEDLP